MMQAKIYNKRFFLNQCDERWLKSQFEVLLKKSGFHIENFIEKKFEPFGYTALFLLSESHFAIHTFPEENKSYCELSSCVKSYYDNFVNNLDEILTTRIIEE